MARLRWIDGALIDDRGVRFRPRAAETAGASLRLLSPAEARRRIDGPPAVRSAMIRREMLQRRVQGLVLPWLFGGASAAYWGVSAWVASRDPDPVRMLLRLGAVFAAGVLVVIGATLFDRWRYARAVARLADLPPSCLVCFYDLTGVPEAGDGCVVCPECGAGWDLVKIAG